VHEEQRNRQDETAEYGAGGESISPFFGSRERILIAPTGAIRCWREKRKVREIREKDRKGEEREREVKERGRKRRGDRNEIRVKVYRRIERKKREVRYKRKERGKMRERRRSNFMGDDCIVMHDDTDDGYGMYRSIYSSDITGSSRAINSSIDTKQRHKSLSHHLHFVLHFSLSVPLRYRISQTRLCCYMLS
jgi:hypothetical protein